MPERIGRDAFVYLEPRQGTDRRDFAQCGPCRMRVPASALGSGFDGDRCVIHGSYVEIDEDDSCALFVAWPTPDGSPVQKVIRDHAEELKKGITGSVTPLESGLVYRLIQCRRCRYSKNNATWCGLYDDLNRKCPSDFSLDCNIKSNACCNAQMPKANHLS